MEEIKKDINIQSAIDEVEAFLFNQPQVYCPVVNTFINGMYIRQTTLPAGTTLTSKIHKTEHPFVILTGKVIVWTKEKGDEEIQAPFWGITKPGTKRIIRAITESTWITFHITDKKTVNEVEGDIIEEHENEFLSEEENILLKNSQQTLGNNLIEKGGKL